MNSFAERESELSELLNSVSGKLISELQRENLRLNQENAKLRLSLVNAKAKLAKKETISLKFVIMQDIIERMTAIRIHRITLPYERMEFDDDDEPKGVRLEISQTMLNTHIDERNVIDYSLYLAKACGYEAEIKKHNENNENDSIDSDDDDETEEKNDGNTNQNSLTIKNNDESSTDVIYVPCLQQRHFKDIEHLRKLLPDIFFDMFGIQHNKLSLFYASLQKYLSKQVT
ncbi:hypothetical protein ACO0SA_000588 [Hanseniaspora valbyensis]